MAFPVTTIPIPAILEIRSGVLFQLEKIVRKHNFHQVVIFFDEFTFATYRDEIVNEFKSVSVDTLLLLPNLNIHDLVQKSFSINQYDAVIAIGGGSIIDYGKYIAFLQQRPFISVPTSASNDGFASSNCSLMVEGKKMTVPARVPYGIIADLDIIQSAPKRFVIAGIGDLMSNITALFDWEFEESHGITQVQAFAYMLSKKAVNSFIRTPMDRLNNPIFIKELVSSLTMGGISTVISGNSSPISGSEHLISHALDKIAKQPQMHGIQVGIATYIMAHVQNHRAERITKVFTRTGFFDHVKTLDLKKSEYQMAIEMAPSIKPTRFTYLHDERFREVAIQLLEEDPILKSILD